jgi:hypothetical protein
VPDGAGLRIATRPEGPAEGEFEVSVAAVPAEDDQVIEESGAQVFLEPHAAEALDDKVLDAEIERARSASRSASRPEGCPDGDAGDDLERSRCREEPRSALGLHRGAGLGDTAMPWPGDGHELELMPSAAPGVGVRVVRETCPGFVDHPATAALEDALLDATIQVERSASPPQHRN